MRKLRERYNGWEEVDDDEPEISSSSFPHPALILCTTVLVIGLLNFFSHLPVSHPPGKLAPADPVQLNLTQQKQFSKNGWSIQGVAKYQVQARVLSTKEYGFFDVLDDAKDIAPIDFALGWGAMSDEAVVKKIWIGQSTRWYFWHATELPIPVGEISSHSANTHLIPADATIEQQLKAVRSGEIVKLSGYLVNISKGNRTINSSTTRGDTGGGACEVMYVEQVINLH